MAQSNLNRFTLFKRTPISKAFCILCGLSTLWDFYLRPPNEAIRDATLLYCSGGGGGLLNWRRVYVSGRLGKRELYWGYVYFVMCMIMLNGAVLHNLTRIRVR